MKFSIFFPFEEWLSTVSYFGCKSLRKMMEYYRNDYNQGNADDNGYPIVNNKQIATFRIKIQGSEND